MTRSRPITFLAGAAAVALSALATVGCGGGGYGDSAGTTPAPPASGQSATIGAANEGELGTILVNSKGRTLYLFRGRLGVEEHVLRRLRRRLAAAAGDRQADGRRRGGCLAGRNHHPVGRRAAGHLQRPPALPLRRRREGRRHQRPGPDRLRRQLVRAHPSRTAGLRPVLELVRIECGRRRELAGCSRSKFRSA